MLNLLGVLVFYVYLILIRVELFIFNLFFLLDRLLASQHGSIDRKRKWP